jgi:hypothetical protein
MLKNPDINLLKQVIQELAAENEGEICTQIEDYYGNKHSDFIIGIKTSTMHRGIGIDVEEDGKVKIRGDFYQYEHDVLDFENLITQTYTAHALNKALSGLGYRTETKKVEDKTVIKAYA